MSEIRRRDMLKLMGVGAAALTAGCTPDEAGKGKDAAQIAHDSAAGAAANPKGSFFTAHERETAGTLADLIIPRDDRSGSATEAGVVDFMDFILTEYPDNQTAIRGGLARMGAEDLKYMGNKVVPVWDGCPPEALAKLGVSYS
jgi:hypothetical protein